MNIRQITSKVFYTGVNDRQTEKFENLWPLPTGISYNSYIVRGSEKVALIDTVELSFLTRFLENIKSVAGEIKPDYLVINHMEPDHSGALPEIMCLFPELKVIGNRQTVGMLKGFYGIEGERVMEIKDNETLSLGNTTLQFILTPMVHWPETMMTFVPEEKVIFSGDAFGCFGALNGGIIDEEMDIDWYFPEMYRYYSNIVGKYGKPVQMALKKTASLEIDYLCSTHGPVWHENKDKVIDIYNRLSLYEGERGVTIVYGSMYGNTQELAEIIAQRLCEKGVKTIKVHNVSKNKMSYIISDAFRYKGLIIGSPTYNGKMFPGIEEFMSAMENREIKNKAIASFGSFTWASGACRHMSECLERMKLQQVGALDMKQSPSANDFDSAIEIADKIANAVLNEN